MSLGGGMFLTQNKRIPGTYQNFVSASRAGVALSDRGTAAVPLVLDWGIEGEVFEVSNADFQKNSVKIFGYEYGHKKLKGLRDLFLNTQTLLAFRLSKNAVKASNTYAEAKYAGLRGNDLKIIIKKNVDDELKFDVSTVLETTVMDVQTVSKADELVANDWVTFKSAELEETASTPLADGTNGDGPTTAEYQKFLDKIEAYSFNALGCPVVDEATAKLFIAFTKRMRDEVGAKFQCVVYKRADANFEGVVSVENEAVDDNPASLVYWTTGAEAGCAVNASVTNKRYDGEYEINVDYTQAQLAKALEEGKFMFHRVGAEIRVLEDINTFVEFTDTKNSDFSSNQIMRVLDQIALDSANIFNSRYLGKVPNNESGRISLWNEIVALHKQLQDIQAIENFVADDIKVAQGDTKKSVVLEEKVSPVSAMSILYMTVVIA